MLVFIDGENFRQRLTDILVECGELADKNTCYDYDLIGLLTEVLGTKKLEVSYYASMIRMPRGYVPSARVAKQIDLIKTSMRRWVLNLKRQGITYIKAGNLKVKTGKPCYKCKAAQEHLQEKGVDVRLALDIFERSLSRSVKEIAVVSSDTDICPVYHKIKDHGVKTNYVCFASSINRGVSAATDRTITISVDLAKKYLIKKS